MTCSRRRAVLTSLAIVQALVVLGPALKPGVAITYDMPWSPDPRWTPFVLGRDTPAPRAVPGDAAAVLVGQVLGAGLAQSVVLLAILTGLALGAAFLLVTIRPTSTLAGQAAAAVAAVWNPFVQERLVVGQWTVVLGIAVLPWALRVALRALRAEGGVRPLLFCTVLAGIGGANSLMMVLVPVISLLAADVGLAIARKALALTLTTGLGAAAVWALPSLTAAVHGSQQGVAAFAPVADTRLGVLLSLVSGGGFWNSASHPAPRDHLVIALTATVLAAAGVLTLAAQTRGRARVALAAAVGVPTALVLVSASPLLRPLWTLVVTDVPGGGLLRDSHKFMAPWVIAIAVGLGLLVELARDRRRAEPLAVLLILIPIALSPTLAWGSLGRVTAVQVPYSYRAAVDSLNALPAGDVGVLPWNQYRRYAWNESRISLTLLPRMVNHTVVFDDGLPLRSGRVPGESPRAAAVTAAIAAGEWPARALASEGRVRYLAVERRAGEEIDEPVQDLGTVVINTPDLLIVEVNPELAPAPPTGPVGVVGWLLTILTVVGICVLCVRPRVRDTGLSGP